MEEKLDALRAVFYEASLTAVQVLNGEEYEKEVYEDVFMINRDNVDMYGTDGWQ